MILGIGMCKEIESQAEILEGFNKSPVIMGDDLCIADAHFCCGHSNGCAVSVGAGNHPYIVATQALVTGIDVRRQISAGHMAQMPVTAGIWPGDADKIFGRIAVIGHKKSPSVGAR